MEIRLQRWLKIFVKINHCNAKHYIGLTFTHFVKVNMKINKTLTMLLMVSLMAAVSLAHEETSTQEIPAGTLPTSIFYSLDIMGEKLSLASTSDPETKLNKIFDYADERTAEIRELLKQGKLDREKQVEVFTHLQTLGARSTLAFEGGAQTSIQAMDACRRVADRWGGLDFILADHLRLFADRDDREVRRLGKISANLREIARELGARNITAAQLSRTVESQADKRPDLKDLRDSGEIEENADNVIALYRKAYYQNGEATSDEAELWIRKARDGERDAKVVLVFLKEWMSFEPKAWLDTITEVPHVREYVN